MKYSIATRVLLGFSLMQLLVIAATAIAWPFIAGHFFIWVGYFTVVALLLCAVLYGSCRRYFTAQSQQQIWQTQQHLAAILDSSPAVVVAIDVVGAVTSWNIKAEVLANVARKKAIGLHYSEAMSLLLPYVNTINAVLISHTPQLLMHTQPSHFGLKKYHEIFVYPLLVGDTVEGAVIRIDEVTQRQQLEAMVVQTEKMNSVGRLAAGIAHEINNPLGAVLQSVQNIQRRLDPSLIKNQQVAEQQQMALDQLAAYCEARGVNRFLEIIQESGERAAKIIKNLLYFSRQPGDESAVVSVAETINKAIELLHTDFQAKNCLQGKELGIAKVWEEPGPLLRCDPIQLQQVFLNILSNAVQAFDQAVRSDPLQLVIRVSEANERVCIEIEDNGPGMSEFVCKRIFEPFFTTKEVGRGTGLGLSVSHHIITEIHNGMIWAESESGKGTVFHIELPV